jgi:ankyrin
MVECSLQNGYAPLHLASSGGHKDIATTLLNNGANANCRSKNGLAPMHLCAQEDRVNVAEILEQHGAEIDPQTKV